MNSENILNDYLSRLLSGGEFSEGNKMSRLREPINNREKTVLPADGGSPVIKSKAMCDHGREGIGSGLRSPAGGEFPGLVCAQTEQAATKRRVSRSRVGHQKC